MTNRRRVFLITLVLALGALPAASSASLQIDPKAVSVVLPENIPWQRGASADTAQLQGDPSKPGIYVQLIRWHRGNMSQPHSHSTARYIYVVSGTWWVGTGSTYQPDKTVPVHAGSYVVDQPNELHYDGAKDEECVLYLVGMGPMTTTQANR